MPYKDPQQRYRNNLDYRAANPLKIAAWAIKSRQKNIDKIRARDKLRDKTPERRELHSAINKSRWQALPKTERQRLSKLKTKRSVNRKEAVAGRPRPELCELCGETGRNGKGMYFDQLLP